MTEREGVDLVPDRVEAVLQVGRLQQLHLVQVDTDEGVGPVAAADVEEGVVHVRQVPGGDLVHPQVAVLGGEGQLGRSHDSWLLYMTHLYGRSCHDGYLNKKLGIFA